MCDTLWFRHLGLVSERASCGKFRESRDYLLETRTSIHCGFLEAANLDLSVSFVSDLKKLKKGFIAMTKYFTSFILLHHQLQAVL